MTPLGESPSEEEGPSVAEALQEHPVCVCVCVVSTNDLGPD